MSTLGKHCEKFRVKVDEATITVGYAFKKGNCLRIGDAYYTIVQPLGKGSVGDVYEVEHLTTRKHYAMKHLYHNFTTNDPKKYYGKLRLLAAHTSPHPSFVWIRGLSEFDEKSGSFSYVMDLVPKGFMPLAYAMNQQNLLTMDQRIAICRKLAEAFAALRKKKWIYGDASPKNILFKPKRNGGDPDVLIIDTDTISPEQAQHCGIEGTGCFRAPEILLGKSPTLNSDVHALAAVMFQLAIGCNALDGTRTRRDHFSEDNVLRHYGENPMYIFDPSGQNKPLKPILRKRLDQLPQGLRVYFKIMFSQERLKGGVARPGPEILLQYLQE